MPEKSNTHNAVDSDINGDKNDTALLESLLFVSDSPVNITRFASVLDISKAKVRRLLDELTEDYKYRGLQLQWFGNQVQLTTIPEASQVVERFLELEVSGRLSPAALEVLSIMAYLQPVTRPQVDSLRGVNSDAAIRTLLNYGLITEVGRKETPGRPILYSTTPEFLQFFGLPGLAAMPALAEGEEEE